MSSADRNGAGQRLERDGVTAVGYLSFVAWAWFLYGFGALLPRLGSDQGISRTETGLHSVGLAVGAMIAGLIAVPLVRRCHRRGVFRIGCLLVMSGIVAITAGGSLTVVTIPVSVLLGTGGSILINTAVSTLAAHHRGHSAAALAEGNALATGVGLVAPLAVGAGLALGITWRPAVVLTIPLLLLTLALVSRTPAGSPAMDEQLPARTVHREPLPLVFWVLVLVVVLCVGVEFCMSSWTAQLLQDQTGMPSGAAAAGVSAVIGGMTVGRLITGRLALRRAPRELLVVALLVALAGWALTWTTSTPWIALTGLLITGSGMGAQYPVGASLLLDEVPGQRDQATGVLSMGIGISLGGGPFVLGALADATDMHTAFLVVPVLLLGALLLLPLTARLSPAGPIEVSGGASAA